MCSKRAERFPFLSSVSKQILIKGWKFLQNIFVFDSFRQGNSLHIRRLLDLASRAVPGAHMPIAYTHTHTHTEDGCLNTTVSAGTFTGCWNFHLMQKCSSASLYLVSARFLILLDIKEKSGEGGKNILLFF